MRSAVRPIAVLAGLVLVLTATATAFAADVVPTVPVSGVVLDTDGQPAEVETARVDEFETPDSEGVRSTIDVADDGTFTVTLREWGTPEQPAIARFAVFGPRGEPVVINDEGCTESTTPFGTVDIEIPGAVPVEPVEIVLDQTLIDGLCPPATATPDPEPDAQAPPKQAPSVTLPPTDGPGGVDRVFGGSWASVLVVSGIGFLALAASLARRAARPNAPTVSSSRARRSRWR